MLLPESMSRVLIVGNRARMEEAVKAIYDIGEAHLIDYSDDDDQGFSIGKSLPGAATASDRLVKLRAIEKELAVKETRLANPIEKKEIRQLIESSGIEELEREVFTIVDSRNKVMESIANLEATRSALAPLTGLPLSLEDYHGYDSLAVFVGKVRSDPSPSLNGLEYELFHSPETGAVALFVAKDGKEEASQALSRHSFEDLSVPAGTGSVTAAIEDIDEQLSQLRSESEAKEEKMESIKDKHLSFLLASEEELSIETSVASTPLRVATSEHSFVMDAWVPTDKADSFQRTLEEKTDGTLHVDILETRGRDLHDGHEFGKRFENPPSKSNNGPLGRAYEFFVKLVSTPRYQESDPSTMIAFTWPLFFGLMVADIGYAIIFIIAGWYLMKRTENVALKSMSTQAFFGGIWAFIFGMFLFGELFGMHFVNAHPSDITTDWQTIIGYVFAGFAFPDAFMSLTINMGKFYDVTTFLKLAVYLGIAHLFFAFLVGFLNVKRQHGTKMAVYEKASFIGILVGIVLVAYAVTDYLLAGSALEGSLLALLAIGLVLTLVGGALAYKVEGIAAILEMPGVFGNIMSYTRLTAVALSKAGIALAFNYMAIFLIYLGIGGAIGIIFGAVVFLIGHILVFMLCILSAGLQGIRLHYVEMMSKFYKGGGVAYAPLSINRLNTKSIEREVN